MPSKGFAPLKRYAMSVDPGVVTAGVCLWEYKAFCDVRRHFRDDIPPPEFALAVTYKGPETEYTKQIEEVFERILMFVDEREIMEVWCEEPMSFGSTKGHAATVDVMHMMYFLGFLSRWTYEQGATFWNSSVMRWKGNLPKHVVNKRIMHKLNGMTGVLSTTQSHDWDACGVGLYGQGRF